MSITYLEPTQAADTVAAGLAERLDSLAGKRIGLLSNGKTNAGRLLAMVGEELTARHGIAGTVAITKGNASSNSPAALLDDLANQVDAVITANGD